MKQRRFSAYVVLFFFINNSAFAFNDRSSSSRALDFESELIREIEKDNPDKQQNLTEYGPEIPNGLSSKDSVRPECDPRRLEDVVLAKAVATESYFKILKKYFDKCGKELSKNSTTGLSGLIKFSKYQYNFLSHPQVKSFLVKLPNGVKIPGILALKDDPKPRPLVIVKCGVFCSVGETASLKSYLMHLFDQSPFNVLLLANQTGLDYIAKNKRVTLGGWSEGYEAIQIGKWMLAKWDHRDRISSIHFMGISLGGNAAVMGAAFNDHYLLDNGKKIFNSVTAICPVVSLRPTLKRLYGSQIVGRVFTKMTKDHFKEVRNFVEDVPDLLTDKKIPGRSKLAEFIGTLATVSLQKNGFNTTVDSFFKNNNFWNWKSEVKTPLLIWASKDDMVVNNEVNAQVIEQNDFYQKSPVVGVVNLEYGNHCAFSSAYGAQISATVLRTFVLNHSPEFKDNYNLKNEFPWPSKFDLPQGYKHMAQIWKFYPHIEKVAVEFKLFNSDNISCRHLSWWGYYANNKCTTIKRHWIPIQSLKNMDARVPRNSVEAQALSREFNTKVEFVAADKHSLNGRRNKNVFVTWRNF